MFLRQLQTHILWRLVTSRAEEFLRQIKNPYCFRVGKVVVKNVYSNDGVSLQERFEQFARTL